MALQEGVRAQLRVAPVPAPQAGTDQLPAGPGLLAWLQERRNAAPSTWLQNWERKETRSPL